MILSLYKIAFLVVLLTSNAGIITSASTMESSSLRGGNGVSASRGNSELAHGFFSSSAITDTVRKLWVGCSITIGDIANTCNDEGYYPMKCKEKGNKSNRAVFRNKCQARLAGYTVSDDGGSIGFVEGDECNLINRCTYFEKGRNTDPVTCNGSTWPDQCVAELFGKCKF